MPGDKSQTTDSDATSPKKLRKILPRPRDSQLVILNRANVKDTRAKEPPNIQTVMQNNTQTPLLTNTVPNKRNVSSQNLPKILPLNSSLPPLAVINQQGMKVNVVKAVWVPSSPNQPPERTSRLASTAQQPRTIKPKDIGVISLNDGNEFCCRLCGKTFRNKGSLVDVLGSEGRSANLQEKVHRCIPISITSSDKLPSTVCQECICVLELSFKLITTALKTDQQLRNKLNQKLNTGGTNRTDVKSNHPEVVTLDNSDETPKQRRLKSRYPSGDHSYISRGSKGDATGADKRTESAANVEQPPDNGSIDPTECNLCGKVFNEIEAFLKHVESDHINDSALIAAKKRNAVQSRWKKADEDDVLSEISLMNCFKCKEICLDDEDLQFHLNYECVVCDVCGLDARTRRAYVLHLKKHHEITFGDIQRSTEKTANKKDTSKVGENQECEGSAEHIISGGLEDGSPDGDHFADGNVGGNSIDGAAENDGCDKEEHTCPVCHKVFRSRVNFDKHQKLHDPLGLERDRDPGTYKCDVCPRSYHRHDNLLKHKRLSHSGEKKIPSTFCEAKFDNSMEKNLHERQDHTAAVEGMDGMDPKPIAVAAKPKADRLWICSHCGKAMSTKPALIEHERIHSGFGRFECEVCCRKFSTKTHLTQHTVVHKGEKKYPCPICEKEFSRQAFLNQHVRSHTGEQPFECDVCSERFSQSRDLNRHRKRHAELDETVEGEAKKRKLADDLSMDEGKDPAVAQLDESLCLSSSSDIADTSDVASEVDTMDTIACEVCAKEFPDLGELREHRFVEHGQEYQEIERAEIISDDTLEEDLMLEESLVSEEILYDEMVDGDGEVVKEYVLVVPS